MRKGRKDWASNGGKSDKQPPFGLEWRGSGGQRFHFPTKVMKLSNLITEPRIMRLAMVGRFVPPKMYLHLYLGLGEADVA